MLKINECLSASEREQVLHRSDTWAWWLVLSNWLIIILLLSLAGFYPSPVTFLFVWLVLPGRQLGLSVLMHEAGHRTLFAHRSLNQWVGQWLCALPTLNDLGSYATGHLDHHRLAGCLILEATLNLPPAVYLSSKWRCRRRSACYCGLWGSDGLGGYGSEP